MEILKLVNDSAYVHCKQVARISELLAIKMGYTAPEVSDIAQAAELHDIGKSGIPPEILNKPGALSDDEYEIVKTHAIAGSRQIEEVINSLSIAALVAKEHHERIDGKSAYLGLSGDDIHPYSKLIAPADVVDALLSKRCYKAQWSIQDVCGYLKEQSGRMFDAEIVAALLSLLPDILRLYDCAGHGKGAAICRA